MNIRRAELAGTVAPIHRFQIDNDRMRRLFRFFQLTVKIFDIALLLLPSRQSLEILGRYFLAFHPSTPAKLCILIAMIVLHSCAGQASACAFFLSFYHIYINRVAFIFRCITP